MYDLFSTFLLNLASQFMMNSTFDSERSSAKAVLVLLTQCSFVENPSQTLCLYYRIYSVILIDLDPMISHGKRIDYCSRIDNLAGILVDVVERQQAFGLSHSRKTLGFHARLLV